MTNEHKLSDAMNHAGAGIAKRRYNPDQIYQTHLKTMVNESMTIQDFVEMYAMETITAQDMLDTIENEVFKMRARAHELVEFPETEGLDRD